MESMSLNALADELLGTARSASAGRASHTTHGGRSHALRQTVVALASGQSLAEHESPGEATLQVLRGTVRLTAGDDTAESSAGDILTIPPTRHSLDALTDSAVLLTVVVHPQEEASP